MKSTGIIRKVDELGRIVIPVEIRELFGIKEKDPIEIYVAGDKIVLKKFQPTCCMCWNEKDLIAYNEKLICKKCIDEINKLKEKEEMKQVSEETGSK